MRLHKTEFVVHLYDVVFDDYLLKTKLKKNLTKIAHIFRQDYLKMPEIDTQSV